jgi:hypothetical protein
MKDVVRHRLVRHCQSRSTSVCNWWRSQAIQGSGRAAIVAVRLQQVVFLWFAAPRLLRPISLVVRIPHAYLLQLFRDDIHEGSALMAVYVRERLTRVRVRQAALRRLAERVSAVGEARSELI